MNNQATSFREAMAENAQQLLFGQGHFESTFAVWPGGRESDQVQVTGLFVENNADAMVVATATGERTDATATVQVLETVDIEAKDVVIRNGVRWAVTGRISSDGIVKRMALKCLTLHRRKASDKS